MGRDRSRSPHTSTRRREGDRDSERDRGRERDERKSRHRSRSRSYDSDERRRRKRAESDDGYSRERERDRHNRKKRSRSRSREKRDKESEKRRKKEERRAEKQRLREEDEARQVAELSVYSAVDNPFHDVNLSQQFKWHKKAEKEKKMGLTVAESRQRDEMRRAEAKEELERLNKRRAEREVEQALREEEEARMQRLAESAQMAEWIAKDGDFQLEQERRRAGIRLREKRAKAIDFLALNLKYASPTVPSADGKPRKDDDDGLDLDEAGMEIDLDEPYAIFENLSLEQTEELHDDIQRYLTLETQELNIDFWTNMMVVCKDKLEKLSSDASTDRSRANSTTVERDIITLLQGKSYEQLGQLQRHIQTKLTSGEPIDVDYWEMLLGTLLVWKAKAKLRNLHEVVVQNRLEQLRKRQRDEALQAQEELLKAGASSSSAAAASKNWGGDMYAEGTAEERPDDAMDIEEVAEPYDRAMSPTLFMDLSNLPPEQRQFDMIDELEDRRQLFALRRTVTSSRFVPKPTRPNEVQNDVQAPSGADLASEAMYRAEAEKNMDEDDEIFNIEEMIENPVTYSWEDKYRPRKPRYFNRVHTGYEWNKYNQTHYDTDNPPPKVVQGYKFNIFYPDLIDKSKAPTYKLVKEPGNDDTVLLCFTAGPPYEDIAFRIVNREWEYSHKRGFRSSFDRGCLSLWFNFRRNFYRK